MTGASRAVHLLYHPATPTRTMRAWRPHEPGGPEAFVFEELPVPEPEAGRVLIKVHAFGLNRSEWFTRIGDSDPTHCVVCGLPMRRVGQVVDAARTWEALRWMDGQARAGRLEVPGSEAGVARRGGVVATGRCRLRMAGGGDRSNGGTVG